MKTRWWIADATLARLAGVGAVAAADLGAFTMRAPIVAFDAAKAPPAPDYADPSAWGALPDRQDATDVAPPGEPMADSKTAPVDVFFIHPTTFFSNTQWNQALGDVATNARTDQGPLRAQASAFNGCCAIYAPRYRQFTFSAIINYGADARGAENLAYSDVKRAFEYYLAHYNHGRPFIIASHSQGSRHAVRLIPELIDNTPLQKQMVAAYIAGNWIPESWFADQKTIKPCERADDTGCVLTWSTLAEGADGQKAREAFVARAGYKPEVANEHFVCTNPISWSLGTDTAPASANLGGWTPGQSATLRPIDPNLVSARCDDGALFISDPAPVTYHVVVLPGGNYHNYDYQVFWMNVRRNAEERVKAYLSKH